MDLRDSVGDLRAGGPGRIVSWKLLQGIVFSGVLLLHLMVATVIRARGWDDGAITLSFARTFAADGHIGLTSGSPKVEGFSSIFWVAWMSLIAWLLPISFAGLIFASQASAAVLAAVSALLMMKVAFRWTEQRQPVAVACGLTMVCGLFINETFNGMEMTLLTVVILGIVLSIDCSRISWVIVCAAIVPMIRLEAAGYLIFAASTLIISNRKFVRLGLIILGSNVGGLVLVTLFRLAVFGEFLPNTFAAKQSPPYSAEGVVEEFSSRLHVGQEMFYVLAPGVLLLCVVLFAAPKSVSLQLREIVGRVSAIRGSGAPMFMVCYIVAVAIVNIVIGRNWGYLGRMELSIVPLAVLLVFWLKPNIFKYSRISSVGALTTVLVLLIVVVVQLDRSKVLPVFRPTSSITVTPAEYRKTGLAALAVSESLSISRLTILTPDVGGVSLCCDQLNVLDLGLLTNPELAKNGYKFLGEFIAEKKPDLVETHGEWSAVSGIYRLAEFYAVYVPVSVNGTAFYLRSDLARRLASRCTLVDASGTRSDRYRGAAIDEAYLAGKRVCALMRP